MELPQITQELIDKGFFPLEADGKTYYPWLSWVLDPEMHELRLKNQSDLHDERGPLDCTPQEIIQAASDCLDQAEMVVVLIGNPTKFKMLVSGLDQAQFIGVLESAKFDTLLPDRIDHSCQ